jgi:outer membrane protein TolC
MGLHGRPQPTGKSMMRWIPASAALALCVAVLSGCERQTFLQEQDWNSVTNQLTVQIEKDPLWGTQPVAKAVEAPPVVDDPNRPPRFLSLSEAIATALENGTPSSNFIGPDGDGIGQVDNTLFAFNRGQASIQTDRIRVLAYNPAIAYNNIEASESRFDAKWITTMNWTVTDQLTNGLNNFNNGETAAFNSSIVKALASGGVANITFNTNYTNLVNPPTIGAFKVINPLYNVPVNFGIEQPLLRDFGVGINQLLNQVAPIQGVTMPLQAANYYNNSRLPLSQGPNFTGLPVQGILLARLSFDQARAEFERQIHNLLLNTEGAYWKLYQAYGNLYTYEEVLRLAHKAWWIAKPNFDAERKEWPRQAYYPILAQYEEFRGERLKALAGVLEAERNLRGIMGIAVEDGTRLVPVTPPTLSLYRSNWQAAQGDALNLRPELVLARQNVKNAQFNLEIQKNFMRPDLRLVGQYTPVGFGTSLDGRGTLTDGLGQPRTSNAFASLAGGSFNNWTVGFTFNVPLGYRLESAALRSARLGLAQAYYFLEDQEEKAQRTLAKHYQKMNEWYRRIEVARAERNAYSEAVKSFLDQFRETPGEQGFRALVTSLVQYERSMALAQLKEYEAITEYNNTLARFEWAKGSIMQHDNVQIAEGPLPQCVQVRAVENERQRTRALIVNERPHLSATPTTLPGMLALDPTVPLDANRPQTAAPPPNYETGTALIRGPQAITAPNAITPPAAAQEPVLPTAPVTSGKDGTTPTADAPILPPPLSSQKVEDLRPPSPSGNSSERPGLLPGVSTPASDLHRDVQAPALPPTAGPWLPVPPMPTANQDQVSPPPSLSNQR